MGEETRELSVVSACFVHQGGNLTGRGRGDRQRGRDHKASTGLNLGNVYPGLSCIFSSSECLKYYMIKTSEWVCQFEIKHIHLHSCSLKCPQ